MSLDDRAADRRRRAAAMFQAGMAQADIARALGLSRQTVSRWHARWRQTGPAGLAPNRRGPRARLTDDELGQVGAALAQGPRSYGFPDHRWSCRQVAWLIHRLTGVSYHPAHVCRMIRANGWSVEPPFDPSSPSPN